MKTTQTSGQHSAVLKFAQNAMGEREISEEKIRAVWSGFTLGLTRV